MDEENALTRRLALTLLAGAGAALAFACGDRAALGDDAGADDAGPNADAPEGGDAGAGGDATPGGDEGSCDVTPEGEIGPYFADDSASGFDRSDITSNVDGSGAQAGVPLSLTISVVDTERGCAPYVDAQVDIWHCNASGVYSDISSEGTASDSYLRGYQRTDAKGSVTFKTILPGWYSGRTTHIHLRIRSSYSDASSTSDGTNTTQLFFDQDLVDTLATSVSPYDGEGKNPTTNAGDRVYSQQVKGATLLTLAGSTTRGYAASVTLGLPITGDYDASAMGGGAPGGEAGPGGPPGG